MVTTQKALQTPDTKFQIRPVRLHDVDALHIRCWSDRPYQWVYQLVRRAQQIAHQGRGLGIVVLNNNVIQAYGQVTMWTCCAEISDLIVAPASRSQGIGTAMIQYLTRIAREMHAPCVEIGVALGNPRALALYRRLGFVDDHVRKLNIGNGQESVLYLKIDFEKDI